MLVYTHTHTHIHTHTYIHFSQLLFPYRLLQNIEYTFLEFLQTGQILVIWRNKGCTLYETGTQTTLPSPCETCMQVKKQQLEPDMENGLVQNYSLDVSTSRLYIVTLLI